MSYDVQIGVKIAQTGRKNGLQPQLFATIDTPEYDHPTYNVGKIIRKSTGWDFKQGEWYCVKDVLDNIEKGIHEMRFNSYAYKDLEPENGWGSTDIVLRALESMLKCIEENTNGWSNNIPIEYLYVRW